MLPKGPFMTQTRSKLQAAIDNAHARGLLWCPPKRKWGIFFRTDYSAVEIIFASMWHVMGVSGDTGCPCSLKKVCCIRVIDVGSNRYR